MRKELKDFPIGCYVTVGEAYAGQGRFRADGNEGTWHVVGHLAPADLKLARTGRGCGEWETICHLGRIVEANWYPNQPHPRQTRIEFRSLA